MTIGAEAEAGREHEGQGKDVRAAGMAGVAWLDAPSGPGPGRGRGMARDGNGGD